MAAVAEVKKPAMKLTGSDTIMAGTATVIVYRAGGCSGEATYSPEQRQDLFLRAISWLTANISG
jgi:hypothetical protein